MLQRLAQDDDAIFLWLNTHLASHALDPVMVAATDLGNGFYLYPLGLFLMVLLSKKTVGRDVALWVSTSLIGLVFERALKVWIARPRPLSHFSAEIQAHHVHIHVVGPHLYALSFPSGHAFSAFSTAALFGGLYPRVRWLLFLIACLTGLSRVYVGAHFPGDVLGGAIIGLFSSWITLHYIRPRIPVRWGGDGVSGTTGVRL
ncbi:MAG: phosphatase PAP2 family protein [Leptospirales bacterium]